MNRCTRSVAIIFLVLVTILGSWAGSPVGAQGDDAPTISVGSMSFTEQLILGEMYSLLLEDAGYTVDRQLDHGVSTDVHEMLVSGDIDLYVEYTGGGLVAILGLPVPVVGSPVPATPAASIEDQVYDAVATAYPAQFGAVWLDPIGFNDTYALAVTRETAERLDLQTISDLQEHAGELTLGTDLEFPERQDGLSGLEAAYGFSFGDVQPGDPGLMYDRIANGDVDVITAYTTDGRLPGLDLVILEDDKSFFPPYFAAPVVRQDVLDANPGLADVLNQLAGKIDDATMAELNAQVDIEGKAPADVARAFLEDAGMIAPGNE